MKKSLLIIFMLLPCYFYSYEAEVSYIVDGDTFKIDLNGNIETIRIYGIDTPEDDQPYGTEATEYLTEMIDEKIVSIEQMDIDYYGRIVGMVYLEDQCVNEALIRDGYAWVYDTYCKEDFCEEWKELETLAKSKKLGLWKDNDPTPPWEFRRGITKESHKYISWIIIISIALILMIVLRFKSYKKWIEKKKNNF